MKIQVVVFKIPFAFMEIVKLFLLQIVHVFSVLWRIQHMTWKMYSLSRKQHMKELWTLYKSPISEQIKKNVRSHPIKNNDFTFSHKVSHSPFFQYLLNICYRFFFSLSIFHWKRGEPLIFLTWHYLGLQNAYHRLSLAPLLHLQCAQLQIFLSLVLIQKSTNNNKKFQLRAS